MIAATSNNLAQGIAWTQNGQRTPSDSMTNYVECNQTIRNAETDLLDTSTAQQARDTSAALKTQFQAQFNAVAKETPKTPEAAKQVMLNVLMCGTFAGAIDRALINVLKETPTVTLPAEGIDPEVHAGATAICTEAPTQTNAFIDECKDDIVPMMNIMRSQGDEIINAAGDLAAADGQNYAVSVAHVFQVGYMVGAAQAELKGNEPG
jgi:hypothetical protein